MQRSVKDREKINKDLELYCALMGEVKMRVHAVLEVLKGHRSTSFQNTNIEFMCLQIRKILELISMGALVVNQDEFQAVGQRSSQYRNARLRHQDIERLHPGFYPIPVNEVPSKEEGIVNDLQDKTSGFLTREDFVTIYEKCGKILHAYNPFGSRYDYDFYKSKIKEWLTLIMELLSVHLINIKGGKGFYLIHMNEKGIKGVHGYFFGPAD